MDLWEPVARERIRDALARYNWSGDAARLDDLAQCFCEDGELELRGGEPVRGAPRSSSFSVASWPHRTRPQRRRKSSEARVACYFTVFSEIGLDHFGRYRDVFVPVGDDWLIRHRFVSTDWSAPNSTMAR